MLERELQEIDQIERDLHELTHEREVLQLKITGAAGIQSTGEPPRMGSGKPPDVLALLPEGHPSMDDDAFLAPSQDVDDEPGTSTAERRLQADAHALEVAIHRNEQSGKGNARSSKRSSPPCSKKCRARNMLWRLEVSIADMDATRRSGKIGSFQDCSET